MLEFGLPGGHVLRQVEEPHLQTNIPGLPDKTSFIDPNPPGSAPAFYRIGVQP